MKSNMQKWEELLNDVPESYKEWFKKEKKYLHNVITTEAEVLNSLYALAFL